MVNENRSIQLFLVVLLVVPIVMGIVKLSFESSKMVKEGRIESIEYYRWDYASTVNWEEEQYLYSTTQSTTRQWSKPPNTVLHFEDGETICFVDIWENFEVGKKYRIVYRRRHVYARGNFHWSGKYWVIDNIEEKE